MSAFRMKDAVSGFSGARGRLAAAGARRRRASASSSQAEFSTQFDMMMGLTLRR